MLLKEHKEVLEYAIYFSKLFKIILLYYGFQFVTSISLIFIGTKNNKW